MDEQADKNTFSKDFCRLGIHKMLKRCHGQQWSK